LDINTSVTLHANPKCGWAFDHWVYGILNPTDSSLTVTMSENKNVQAVFSQIFSNVSVEIDSSMGSVSSSETPANIHCNDQADSLCHHDYPYDASVALVASPKSGIHSSNGKKMDRSFPQKKPCRRFWWNMQEI
jgi:hypothetical protein